MSITLHPLGTKTCQWDTRVPAQSDGNAHLNVRESMSSPSDGSYIAQGQPVAPGRVFEVFLGEVDFEGEFLKLEQEFRFTGLDDFGVRTGVILDVLLDGQSIVDPKTCYVNTDSMVVAGQVTWVEGQFLSGLTGEHWNNASERLMRATTGDAFSFNTPVVPDPWVEG